MKNMKPLEIAAATREELYEIAAFLDDCWRVEYKGIIAPDYLDAMSADERHEKLLKRFDKTASDFLVMRNAGRLIGVSIFGKSYTNGYPDDGEISAIYLSHDCIGKGHGHALITKVEAALAERGCTYFVLDVLSGNTRAIAFYQKHGYETVDERTIRLGDIDYPLTVLRKKNCLGADGKSSGHRAPTEMTQRERSRLFPVVLCEYNPAWVEWFEEEKANLERLLGSESIFRISHIGSTAVPGLLAKPTVDILLEIMENTDIERLIAALPDDAYICLRQQTIPTFDRIMLIKGYTSDGFAERVYHIHVRYPGDWDEVHFRDYLLAHPEAANAYATLKRSLKERFEHDRDAYTNAKLEFVKAVTKRARNLAEKMDDFFAARIGIYDYNMLNNVEGLPEGYFELTKHIPADTRTLLDLGCGTGLELEEIFKINPDINVTGIDLTQPMLDRLTEKYNGKNVTTICASYLDYDLGEDMYDYVISFETMHHWPHEVKVRVYNNILRALKSGGRYIECDYMVEKQSEEDYWFSESRRIRAEQNIPDDEFYHLDTPCTIDNQIKLFLQAGFTQANMVWRKGGTSIIVADK